MPSESSSSGEPLCIRCGYARSAHNDRRDAAGWPEGPACMGFLAPEPPESDGPSKDDDMCRCGHEGRSHVWDQRGRGPSGDIYRMQCNICYGLDTPPMVWQHDFIPVTSPHEHEWGPWELRPTIGDNVEASYCACGASKARQCEPDGHGECPGWPECPAPGSCPGCTAVQPATPRPPYAVAYAVQGGALYEVALPGDATACAEDGALIITHTKTPVLGIVRVTPMRTEED